MYGGDVLEEYALIFERFFFPYIYEYLYRTVLVFFGFYGFFTTAMFPEQGFYLYINHVSDARSSFFEIYDWWFQDIFFEDFDY